MAEGSSSLPVGTTLLLSVPSTYLGGSKLSENPNPSARLGFLFNYKEMVMSEFLWQLVAYYSLSLNLKELEA